MRAGEKWQRLNAKIVPTPDAYHVRWEKWILKVGGGGGDQRFNMQNIYPWDASLFQHELVLFRLI